MYDEESRTHTHICEQDNCPVLRRVLESKRFTNRLGIDLLFPFFLPPLSLHGLPFLSQGPWNQDYAWVKITIGALFFSVATCEIDRGKRWRNGDWIGWSCWLKATAKPKDLFFWHLLENRQIPWLHRWHSHLCACINVHFLWRETMIIISPVIHYFSESSQWQYS